MFHIEIENNFLLVIGISGFLFEFANKGDPKHSGGCYTVDMFP